MKTLSLLLGFALSAAPAKPSMLDSFRALFDRSPEKVRATLACKAEWKKTEATNALGKSYTVETCPDAKQEVMLSGGKVFAVGVPMVDRTDSLTADAQMKALQADLLGAKCKELRKPGQLGLYDCSGSFTVAVTENWNSKDDTHTVSALFGDTPTLHGMLGIK